jgi:hypothetical protein
MKYQFFWADLSLAIISLSMAILFGLYGEWAGCAAFAFSMCCFLINVAKNVTRNKKADKEFDKFIELIVNDATQAKTSDKLSHLYIQVNASEIRNETVNGIDFLVLPSYTLPDNVVMNDGLYTREEIDKNYMQLNGTLAPMGHPKIDGEYVSAFHPQALISNHIGAYNDNVERRGNRIYMEKWVPIAHAKKFPDGERLLKAVENGEPIHTSVAVYANRELTPNAAGFKWKAKIFAMDHDAILLDVNGAATPEQGVGLMVNVADAKPLIANASALSSDSYGSRSRLLGDAARESFGSGSSYAWVEDFDSVRAIVTTDTGSSVISYSIIDGKVVWGSDSKPVARKETWQEKFPIVNTFLQSFKFALNSRGEVTDVTPKTAPSEAIDMTPEEIQAMLDKQAERLEANTAAQLKPLQETITQQGATIAQIQANADAAKNKEETEMRTEVAKIIGNAAADLLKGDALVEAFKKVQPNGESTTTGNLNANNKDNKAPDPATYLSK